MLFFLQLGQSLKEMLRVVKLVMLLLNLVVGKTYQLHQLGQRWVIHPDIVVPCKFCKLGELTDMKTKLIKVPFELMISTVLGTHGRLKQSVGSFVFLQFLNDLYLFL